MKDTNIETAVIQLGDVQTVIEMADRFISEGNIDQTERAIVILKEIFESRYKDLKAASLV